MIEPEGTGARGAVVAADTAESYRVLGGRADAGIVLLCDHASNGLPADCGTLGLAAAELQRHIAYDIGAAAITEHLSALLEAPAVLSRHSRLLIDINRGEEDERFAFGFVLDPDDRDYAFVFPGKSEQLDDLLFDRFVRNHFAADL